MSSHCLEHSRKGVTLPLDEDALAAGTQRNWLGRQTAARRGLASREAGGHDAARSTEQMTTNRCTFQPR